MRSLPREFVKDGFALSESRGADLLVRLSAFDVWHGDLATMRGDHPREAAPDPATQSEPPNVRFFLDTLILARAIELLQPICRAALAAVYSTDGNPADLAEKLDTSPKYAEKIVSNCERRLLEAYESLRTSRDDSALPQWVSEREHVAVGGSRRR